jgi:CheY-like chemotaxis protein
MGKKVLTIDDSRTVRSVISKHLSQFSVGMSEAENGEQGIAVARENMPDLILLDYNMPVMDGYHTLVELKTDPELKSIPVVMVTTETSKEMVVRLLKLGLNDYIAKPFTRELLLKKINPILNLYNGDLIPADLPEDPPRKEPETAVGASSTDSAILVVDDKASVRDLMKEYLDGISHLVTADSGRGALAAMSRGDFDHIFLDLNMPDMSGFDVFQSRLRRVKDEAEGGKFIAMALRSALPDIHRASELGIPVILYKPFTRADVQNSLEQSIIHLKESSTKRHFYLAAIGKARILECPPQKSFRFRLFVESLNSGVRREIDAMTEEGSSLLVIKIGAGFLAKPAVAERFMELINHIRQLPLTIRFVTDSSQSRAVLRKLNETARIPMDVSVECALSAMAS